MELHRPGQKRQDASAAGVVHRLKARRAPEALIDHGAREQPEERVGRVDTTGPEGVAPGVELVRVLSLEESLGLAVANLLPPVRRRRRATMMPDHCRRTEPDSVAPVQQTPADVYVVRRLREDRIEPAYLFQRQLPEGHVAARDVLG